MTKTLIIVESPTKARTIGQYLGRDYVVKASMGHVRDLPKSELGVNTDTFEPVYIDSGKMAVVRDLKTAAKQADDILLATDPDREGEAIAWHIANLLKIREPRRLEFHEITRPAIQQALSHPQALNQDLVDAQQARRVLDRLVGYGLSPLLWRKVQAGISAGRVQSVAVRLICDREREIQAFVPEESWSIDAELRKLTAPLTAFRARLIQVAGNKASIKTEDSVKALTAELEKCAYRVKSVVTKPVRRNPPPPFTTSTLQQAAAHRLGMSAKRTMAIAQQLYEGVALPGEGQVGLITYMRTDSVNLADSAVEAARRYIHANFSPAHLPKSPNRYRTKAKNAQEAHEAIRPTNPELAPQQLRAQLDHDQFRLYELIWQRMIASQMAPAVYSRTTVDIDAGVAPQVDAYLFRATASRLVEPGYLAVYGINVDEQAEEPTEEGVEGQNTSLPPLSAQEVLELLGLAPEQHFSVPPPRFNEASLVRTLEQLGIGRPSTYAQILSTVQERGYVERQNKLLVPTALGFASNDFLVEHFGNIVDPGFTAELEEELDEIAGGSRPWRTMLKDFYGPFASDLTTKQSVPHVKVQRAPAQETGEVCPLCGKPLVERTGRFGAFVGCSGYPTCKYIKRDESTPPAEPTGVACPRCGQGELLKRIASRGRNKGSAFYGCSRYPKCRFAANSLEAAAEAAATGSQSDPLVGEVPATKKTTRRTAASRPTAATAPTRPASTTRKRATASPASSAPATTRATTARQTVAVPAKRATSSARAVAPVSRSGNSSTARIDDTFSPGVDAATAPQPRAVRKRTTVRDEQSVSPGSARPKA